MNDVALIDAPDAALDGADEAADGAEGAADGAEDADDDDDEGADDADDEDDPEDVGAELLEPVAVPLLLHAATTRLAATNAVDHATFFANTFVPFFSAANVTDACIAALS